VIETPTPRADIDDLARTPPAAPISLDAVASLLRGLDGPQRRAVTHGEGPLLVLAGPGTGKTRVVTRRIAWLITTKRAAPNEILALTYTDRAADEMQGRVDELVPYGYADTVIQTFHAFGDRLVREHALRLGLPPEPRLLTRPESVSFLRERLFRLGLDHFRPLGDPGRFLDALVSVFARAKQEGVSSDGWAAFAEQAGETASSAPPDERAALRAVAERQVELAHAYQAYEALLREAGAIDFGDQVGLAGRLLREGADLRRELRMRHRYVLVDEFQDTDPAQIELLELLVGAGGNVTAVGDDDQAIYGFRGAAAGSLPGFIERFPGTRTVTLRRNHRSRRPILEVATRLIGHNGPGRLRAGGRPRPDLTAVRRARPRPVVMRAFESTAVEADWIVAEIARRIAGGARPGDHAVLVRANADAAPILRAAAREGIPCWSGAGSDLYQRPVIRELLAFLRVAADLDESLDLWALATAQPYGMGGVALTQLLREARQSHRSLWAVLSDTVTGEGPVRLGGTQGRAARRLVADLRAASELVHRRPAVEVLYDHLKRSGRLAELAAAGPAAEPALADLGAFFEAIRRLAEMLPDARLPVLLPHLQGLVEAGAEPAPDDREPPEDAVHVLTVHKAKGSEYPVVFVAGLAEGRFPARGRASAIPFPDGLRRSSASSAADRAMDGPAWAEERRLAYVALTRARDELFLTWSARGQGRRRRRPSPFLAEAWDRPLPGIPETAEDALTAIVTAGREPVEPPDGAARRAPHRLDLSFSQLETYLSCPQQYRYRYVLGVPTPTHHRLSYGSAMHAAVAVYHTAEMSGRPLDEAGLEAALRGAWRPDGYLSQEHEEERFRAGLEALRRFRAARLESQAPPPRAVEAPFAVALEGDRIRGRFDRLDETEAGPVITDYKTSDVREPRKAAQRARSSLQLAVYALAYEAAAGRPPAGVQLHFLDSGLVGRAKLEPAELARVRAKIHVASAGIRGGAFAASPDPMTCAQCPYRRICPASVAS
jgi:ATP-dependent DNA helicase UvrD/PcrA